MHGCIREASHMRQGSTIGESTDGCQGANQRKATCLAGDLRDLAEVGSWLALFFRRPKACAHASYILLSSCCSISLSRLPWCLRESGTIRTKG